jgi:hypothetical protein
MSVSARPKLIPYVGQETVDYHARFGRGEVVAVSCEQVRELMRKGLNTKQIALRLRVAEAQVWNAMAWGGI